MHRKLIDRVEMCEGLRELPFGNCELADTVTQIGFFTMAPGFTRQRQTGVESRASLQVVALFHGQGTEVVERHGAPADVTRHLPTRIGTLEVTQSCRAIAMGRVGQSEIVGN